MYLSKEEEKILNGERGEAFRVALETIVKVGDVLNAEKLVEINWAHISGISYKNLGDSGLEFIEDMKNKGAKFNVFTTINPSAISISNYFNSKIPSEFLKKQKLIIEDLVFMGAKPLLSCIPYLYKRPKYREQIAWGESNAVLYANSVFGAYTNREGGPIIIFEAISRRAPYIGLRVKKNREPTRRVIIDNNVFKYLKERLLPFSLIGYSIGEQIKTGIPYILNSLPLKYIKEILAGVGASSSIGLVYLHNISPEEEEIKGKAIRVPLIRIRLEDIKASEARINEEMENADAFFLGCPHLSPRELNELYNFLKGRRLKKKNLIVATSKWVYDLNKSIVNELMSNGIRFIIGTCIVVAPLEYLGIKSIVTDSSKAAYYLSSQGLRVKLMSREKILEKVVE